MIRHLLATSALRLELDRAPYVWYGVQYIDLVSLSRTASALLFVEATKRCG